MKRSACVSPRCSAPASPACCTCSTNPPSGCTPPTVRGSSKCCVACATWATPCSSSNTTWTMLRAADHVIDVGPGAGRDGGRIVAAGHTGGGGRHARGRSPADCLSGRVIVPAPAAPRTGDGRSLVDPRAPGPTTSRTSRPGCRWGCLVAVSGPSGSGKSSLLLRHAGPRRAAAASTGRVEKPGPHDGIDGWEHIDKVVTIDQQPISRLPRSNAATYSDAFTPMTGGLRRHARRTRSGPDREALLAQRARRPVRTLRGCGRAHRPDALPARRGGALPRPATDAGSGATCSPRSTEGTTSRRC